jgi:hypothetical protein
MGLRLAGPAALLLRDGVEGGREAVERAAGTAQEQRGDGGVAGGGIDAAMAEQDLNGAEFGAAFEQVGGEAVPAMPHAA